jgi:hypothetical protein
MVASTGAEEEHAGIARPLSPESNSKLGALVPRPHRGREPSGGSTRRTVTGDASDARESTRRLRRAQAADGCERTRRRAGTYRSGWSGALVVPRTGVKVPQPPPNDVDAATPCGCRFTATDIRRRRPPPPALIIRRSSRGDVRKGPFSRTIPVLPPDEDLRQAGRGQSADCSSNEGASQYTKTPARHSPPSCPASCSK